MTDMTGKPVSELPAAARTRRRDRHTLQWEKVRDTALAHRGKWVPVRLTGKTSAYGTAGNIRGGRIRPMVGAEVAVRDGKLYVRFI